MQDMIEPERMFDAIMDGVEHFGVPRRFSAGTGDGLATMSNRDLLYTQMKTCRGCDTLFSAYAIHNTKIIRQLTMSLISDELREASTPKKVLLERMDSIIPWEECVTIVSTHYYKGERGNKPFPLELMLRIYVLQNLYNLADMAVRYEIIDSRTFSDFFGVDSSNQVPDGDTIGRFRNILTKNGLQDKLFYDVVRVLESEGLMLRQGTIVDSTLIESPSSTKNKTKSRDSEAHQTKKGNMWHFGYKAHIGVDEDSGLIHTLETTAANVSDVAMTPKLMTGQEEELVADAGYIEAEKREDAMTENKYGEEIDYRVCKRPSSLKKLRESGQEKAKEEEHEKSSVRCKVEHVFGVVKLLFRCRKTRYRGRKKVNAQLKMVFALANLYLADTSLSNFFCKELRINN